MQDAFNEVSFVSGDYKVRDYDDNQYATVKIGFQCWMKENVRSTHYSVGTEVEDCIHVDGSFSCSDTTFGLLYPWSGALNGK